jgi:hypothetical protein
MPPAPPPTPTRTRPSTLALSFIAVALLAVALSFADAARLARSGAQRSAQMQQMVQRLALTDVVLFTEARYTRHRSQADLHSAFQDHPLALEHFPSGSLLPPPRHDTVDRTPALPD